MLSLLLPLLLAITRPTPDQIHDWTRVAPPTTSQVQRSSGTTLTIDQLSIDPTIVAYWSSSITPHIYHHYYVAPNLDLDPSDATGQATIQRWDLPTLIQCLYPSDSPAGPGCVESYRFWFVDR